MRIWFDIKNSPEVLFFIPILRRLGRSGVETIVTSRDFAQTLGMLDLHGVRHTPIGRHGGGSIAGKAINLVRRSTAVTRFGRTADATQAVSFGSNDLSIASRVLRLHHTVIQDYEHAALEHRINFRLADKVMFPEAVPLASLAALGLDAKRYRPIRGIKEQVTLSDFVPDTSVITQLALDRSRIIAVMRPPATMSLYHRGRENLLFNDVVAHLRRSNVQIVLLPRSREQRESYAGLPGVTIPRAVLDAPSLMYASDLVIGAGGSMNREAALIGVPTWTTFAGQMGAVDRMLIDQGRMSVLRHQAQLLLSKRDAQPFRFEPLADEVTHEILRR